MRLYRLIARYGKRKRRMYPWFDPPDPAEPAEYYGWLWDPTKREWIKSEVETIKIELKLPTHPKPKYPPRKEQSLDVPGWYWDGREKEWKEVPIPEQLEYIEKERPPEPDFLPRPEQGLVEEGWYWNGRKGMWVEAEMPIETQYVERERPPEPEGVPTRDQPAEVLGWRYSFIYEVWEKIPMPRVPVQVRKQRPTKPVYPPGPYRPSEVLGWEYSDMYQSWQKVEMPYDVVDVTPERPPKPKIEPGIERPAIVEGWSWDEIKEEWFATTIYSEPVELEDLPTFSPGITQEAVNNVLPPSEQYKVFYDNLIAMGLTQTEAKRIGGSMVDGFWKMTRPVATKIRAAEYAKSLTPAARAISDQIEFLGVSAALIALSAIVGAMVGTIARRVTLPDEEYYVLSGGIMTYLIGPDNWEYSRYIGRSAKGREYYSACGGIGTSYVRHFRGHGIGEEDTLDFPGGFLEQGYKVPYYVKYVWQSWRLEYVGMLESVGNDFYVLKEGKGFVPAVGGIPEIAPYEEWCPEFRFYL